jgi:hypothetical protein
MMRPRSKTTREARAMANRPTVATFRDDQLYPKIARAVREILAAEKVVTPVAVVEKLGWLAPANLERWRRGEVAALEHVVTANLSKVGRCLRILRMHAHDLSLVGSVTVYVAHGSRRRLRFSKTGDAGVEAAWSRHFVWPGKGPFPLDCLGADGRPRAAPARSSDPQGA